MPAVSEEPWDGADGVRLRAAMEAELAARYGIPDQETDKPTARDTDVFLVARDAEGNATGCGALRRLSEDTAETKRMYVVPELRGTGVATGVLRTLEDHASRLGCKALHLSTGVLHFSPMPSGSTSARATPAPRATVPTSAILSPCASSADWSVTEGDGDRRRMAGRNRSTPLLATARRRAAGSATRPCRPGPCR